MALDWDRLDKHPTAGALEGITHDCIRTCEGRSLRGPLALGSRHPMSRLSRRRALNAVRHVPRGSPAHAAGVLPCLSGPWLRASQEGRDGSVGGVGSSGVKGDDVASGHMRLRGGRGGVVELCVQAPHGACRAPTNHR